MIKPGLLAVLSPIVVGVFFKQIGALKGDELLGAKVEILISVYLLVLDVFDFYRNPDGDVYEQRRGRLGQC